MRCQVAYGAPNWIHSNTKRCPCGSIIRHAGQHVPPEHVCRDCIDTLCEVCCKEARRKSVRVTATPEGWRTDDGLTFKPYQIEDPVLPESAKPMTFCGYPIQWMAHMNDCASESAPPPAVPEEKIPFVEYMQMKQQEATLALATQMEKYLWAGSPEPVATGEKPIKLTWWQRVRLVGARFKRGVLRVLCKRFDWIKDPDDPYDYY